MAKFFLSCLILLLPFSLYNCKGYQFLCLNEVEPGSLATRMDQRTANVSDLCLSGRLDTTDLVFLENLLSGSDILQSLDLSEAQLPLQPRSFAGCEYLRQMRLPQYDVEVVPAFLFEGCSQLQQVILSKNCKQVGEAAFSNCKNLHQIYLPESMEKVGPVAFKNCVGLQTVYSASSIPPRCSPNSFDGVSVTCRLVVPKGAATLYQRADGWSSFAVVVEQKNLLEPLEVKWGRN